MAQSYAQRFGNSLLFQRIQERKSSLAIVAHFARIIEKQLTGSMGVEMMGNADVS